MKHSIVLAAFLAGPALAAPPVSTLPVALLAVGGDDAGAIAAEEASFTLDAPTTVTFGGDGKTVSKTLPAGTYSCDRAVFGADPAPGVRKACSAPARSATARMAPAASVVAPVAPTAAVRMPALDVGITDPAEYRRVAALFGSDAGITYRYGSPSNAKVTQAYPGPRPSFSLTTLSIQRKEKQLDGALGNRGCNFDGWCGEAQYGRIFGEPGDYSSSIVNVGFIPTVPKPGGWPRQLLGLSSLQTIGIAHNTISLKPEESWTTYNYDFSAPGGINDDPNTRAFASGKTPIGGVPIDGKPVFTVGGIGRGGWTNNAMTGWANGWITSSGSNTSRNYAKIKLADGKVPTGGAITNSGEFMFVTVWDTAAFKGPLAVVALKDGCQGCLESDESKWERNWGSSRQAYAGFPGLGNYTGGKVLGYVDLPDGMRTPTEVSATTGRANDAYQVVRNFWDDHMLTAANRARLYSGDKKGAVPNTGMAVVIDKTSRRAAFIDLRPLMSYYREQYVGPQTDAQWNARIANRGDGASQWPPTFDAVASQKPVVAKVIDLPSRPTAVKLTLHAPHRAAIASEDGVLRVFDLGARYLDQTGSAGGRPADIVQLFTHPVGRNPTSLAHVKEKANLGPNGDSTLWGAARFDDFMWAVSRGERKATLLRWNTARTKLTDFRVLQDARMTDPIALDDTANHGTESYSATIANYATGEVQQWRYGPIVMWTYDPKTAPCPKPNGCGMLNGARFEFAGSARLPGKPFSLHGANIN